MGVTTPLIDKDGYPRADVDVHRARVLRNRLAVITTDHKEIMKKIEEGLKGKTQDGNGGMMKEEDLEEKSKRLQDKPKPKYDKVTGKWVVPQWDGTVCGIDGGDKIKFEDIGNEKVDEERRNKLSLEGVTISDEMKSDISPPQDPSLRTTAPLVIEQVLPTEPFAIVDSITEGSPSYSDGLRRLDEILQFGGLHGASSFPSIPTVVQSAAIANKEIDVYVLRRLPNRENVHLPGKHQTLKLCVRPRQWEGRGMLGCHILPFVGPVEL